MIKKLLLTTALVVAGGGFYFYTVHTAAPEPTVAVQPFSRGDVVEAVSASGTLEAVETVAVGTQVSGVVQSLHADFNSIVTKGQIIARLDPQLLQSQIAQQQANVVRAEADLERLKVNLADARHKLERAGQLAERMLIPRTELETAEVNVKSAEAQLRSSEAAVTQARAQLNNSRVNLAYATITAPIDGIVISRNVDQGQTVAASMNAPTLYVIAADLTRMQVIASIDEADVGRVRPGQQVRFTVDAYPANTFTGTVAQVRLQPAVVQNVVTYSTVISVPNRDLQLKPGMTANVTIEVVRRDDVLRVSNAALRFRPGPEMFAALEQPVPPDLPHGRSRPVDVPSAVAPAADGTAGAGDRMPGEAVDRARLPDTPRGGQAATLDSLFAPLGSAETSGTVWVYDGTRLQVLPLRLGVTDGTFTEVLNAEAIPEGAQLVVSMSTGRGQRSSTAAAAARSPLMGAQRGGRP